jgi:hypothetical protein
VNEIKLKFFIETPWALVRQRIDEASLSREEERDSGDIPANQTRLR